MDYQEIRKKYACDDDFTKSVNAGFHNAKSKGVKFPKETKDRIIAEKYIKSANNKLGRSVRIYSLDPDLRTFGVNWSARGTVSVPETQDFIKKLQMAVDFIRNIPKTK